MTSSSRSICFGQSRSLPQVSISGERPWYGWLMSFELEASIVITSPVPSSAKIPTAGVTANRVKREQINGSHPHQRWALTAPGDGMFSVSCKRANPGGSGWNAAPAILVRAEPHHSRPSSQPVAADHNPVIASSPKIFTVVR